MNKGLKIFDYLQELVYITEIETNNLIYMNNSARQLLGNEKAEGAIGQKCYEVIQGRTEPCSFCTNSRLEKEAFIEWEHHNEVIQRTFLLRDTLFTYEGKKYRLEIGSDKKDINYGSESLLQNYRTHETIINEGLRIALTPDDPNEGIQNFLTYVGNKSGAERVYIFEISGEVSNNTYEWCAEGITPQKSNLQNVTEDVLNIWYKAFEKGENIIIHDIEDIKESDSAMYRTLKPQNIHTLIACQLVLDGELVGFCGFDNPPRHSIEACTGFLNILSQYLGVLISKRNYIREKVYESIYDPLTGLYNREFFFSEVNKIMEQNPERTKWLLLVNTKDFKLINNLYGTEFGDLLLKIQGKIISQFVGEDTICGRIYGDKFVLLIQRDNYDKGAFEKAFSALSKEIEKFNYSLCHHIVACNVTEATLSAESLFNCLTIGAKSVQNKHEFAFVDCDYDEIEKKYVEDTNILSLFPVALSQNQFEMFLQPHIDTTEGLVGCEALVRWKHPSKGLVFPNAFIPIIEKAGLIYELDCYMWENAARKLAEWKERGLEYLHISVNVSSADFYNLDVYSKFVELVEKYKISPANLILEITESAIIENFSTVSTAIKKLQLYGFKVAVDDFGKGYSSLNMVVELPFDIIKFDSAFLNKPKEEEEKNHMVLDTLIGLAKKLKAVTIFEGVETKEQFSFLTDMGADYFQGYYFAKPICVEEFEEKYKLK